jgi:hypothetical protein
MREILDIINNLCNLTIFFKYLGYDRDRRDRRNRKPEEDNKVIKITFNIK